MLIAEVKRKLVAYSIKREVTESFNIPFMKFCSCSDTIKPLAEMDKLRDF